MTVSKKEQLGKLLKKARVAKGLGVRELARAVNVAPQTISRLEEGAIEAPRPDKLARLARVLEIELEDIYALAGYVSPRDLPELVPYLRAKYDLSPSALRELQRVFDELAEPKPKQTPHRKGGRGA